MTAAPHATSPALGTSVMFSSLRSGSETRATEVPAQRKSLPLPVVRARKTVSCVPSTVASWTQWYVRSSMSGKKALGSPSRVPVRVRVVPSGDWTTRALWTVTVPGPGCPRRPSEPMKESEWSHSTRPSGSRTE